MDEQTPCKLKAWLNMLLMLFHAILRLISNYCFCAISSRELFVCAIFYAFSNYAAGTTSADTTSAGTTTDEGSTTATDATSTGGTTTDGTTTGGTTTDGTTMTGDTTTSGDTTTAGTTTAAATTTTAQRANKRTQEKNVFLTANPEKAGIDMEKFNNEQPCSLTI